KGDARMAAVIERAAADRERPLPNELVLLVDGMRLRVPRGGPRRSGGAGRKRRGTHNEKRPMVVRRFVDLLVTRYKNALTRDYRERRLDAPASNVTSLFERDAAPDPTVAGALARGEAPPEGWEQ